MAINVFLLALCQSLFAPKRQATLLYVIFDGQNREAFSLQVRCHDSCLRSSSPPTNRQHYMFRTLKIGYLHESNLHAHLCRLELLPMHSQERQAPQLPYITLR